MYLGHTAEHYVVSQLPLNETGYIKFHTCILHLADLAESSQEPSQRQSWVDACHRGTFWQTLTCACWGRVWSAIATMQRGQATLQKSKNQLHVGEASAELGDFELWTTERLEHIKYLGLEGAIKSHGIPRLIIIVRGGFYRHLNWIRGSCRVPDLQVALDQKGSYCHPGCCWGLLKKNPSAELEKFAQPSPTVRHPTSTSARSEIIKNDQKWSVAARQRWWSPEAPGSRRISCSWSDMQQL